MDIFAELMERLAGRCPGLELREHEPMAKHTSFRVGGPVRLMALPRTAEEAVRVVQAAAELGIKPFFMGNGSNLLVADGGWEGLIVKTFDGLSALEGKGDTLRAGSGLLLSRLANAALDRGLTGLEFAHGIPGSLGGGVTMNAGAYGGELKDVLVNVTVMDREGNILKKTPEELCMGYRTSSVLSEEYVVLEAEINLEKGDRRLIRARMDDLAARRREKQPLEYPSAGSTFKRPEGYFAGKLIDDAGLRGFRVGGAQVAEKHCGFVINREQATAADVMELCRRVSGAVKEQFGVELEMEVKTIGNF